eukprot:scaffold14111_cov17-Tisochrysis_lutea.AAC.2
MAAAAQKRIQGQEQAKAAYKHGIKTKHKQGHTRGWALRRQRKAQHHRSVQQQELTAIRSGRGGQRLTNSSELPVIQISLQ